MNFISEFIEENFAFIATIDYAGNKNLWKIDKDSHIIENFIDYVKERENQEWLTINGVPLVKCITQLYEKVKMLPMFKETNELDMVHQFISKTKNNDGKAFNRQFNLTELLGKDITLAYIMNLQENKKIGYFTEVEYLKEIYPFYEKDIDFRNELEEKYEINPYDSKYNIVHEIFKKKGVEKEEGKEREKEWNIKDVLIKYDFKDKELSNLLTKVSNLSVKDDDTADLINETIKVKGLDIKVGMGGLHGCRPGEFESNEKDVVLYFDVNSYYPSIIINNKLVPNNLKNFQETYKEFYDLKMSGEKRYKDLINFVYGFSKHKESLFYDPKFNVTITLNGELMMLELLNGLAEVKTLVPLIVNTDGFYVIVSREEVNAVEMKVAGWKTAYNLELKSEEVDKISIKDGNNYFKIGKVGKYEHPLVIDYQEVASYDGTGIFNPILLTNNPLKLLGLKKEAKKELYKWLTR